MKKKVIIIGAGGFASVVMETIEKLNEYTIIGFAVDNLPINTIVFNHYSIISDCALSSINTDNNTYFIVAIGDNYTRTHFFETAKNKFQPLTLIDPSAKISKYSKIGEGTIILANTIIHPNSSIGSNCIINAGVIIDHDCTIGSNIHLNIGTVVPSKSKIII